MKNRLLAKFRNSFLAGLAVVLPLAVTVMFLNFLVKSANNILFVPAAKLLKPFFPNACGAYLVKVFIFFAVLTLVALVGFATKLLFLRRFFSFWEGLLYRLPLINKVYKGVKQISVVFLDKKKQIFEKVVLVEYPRKGIYSIGFTTGGSEGEIPARVKEDLVHVFVPTTPNPTSGMVVLFPKRDLIMLDMSIEDGMKFVISAGSVVPQWP